MKKPMFERSAITQKICDLLYGVNGDIAYQRIEDTVGMPIREIRGHINSARGILEGEHGIVFEAIRNFGLRRLSDSEKLRSTEKTKLSIVRTSRRGIKRLDAITDMASLSNEEQLQATLNRTIFTSVKQGASTRPSHAKTAQGATPDLARIIGKAPVAGRHGT